jgi:predicted transcriptional regulator
MISNSNRLAPLPPGEWAIFVCVWELGYANAGEVSAQLRDRRLKDFAPSTAGVLLARLANKGYLEIETKRQSRGRPLHYYRPLVSRDTALEWQLQHFFRDHLLTCKDVELVSAFLSDAKLRNV